MSIHVTTDDIQVIDSEMVVWPGQSEMMTSNDTTIGMFTGAGYGKSEVLCRRLIYRDISEFDHWWEGQTGWRNNHLKYIVAAPHDKYLTLRLVPAMRGTLDQAEELAGRRIRARTGRYNDGFFGSKSDRRQELKSMVDMVFYPLPTAESAVAVDACGFACDEVTMLTDAQIWNRSLQRVRDPRVPVDPKTGKPKFFIRCTGTPEEDHFIHDMLIDPETGLSRPDTTVITDSSVNNPFLPDVWFRNAGEQMSKALRDMQVYGRWVSGASGQRFAHLLHADKGLGSNPLIRRIRWRPTDPEARGVSIRYIIGWDLGYRTGHVGIWCRHTQGGIDRWMLVDEISVESKTTEQVAQELMRRGYTKYNIEHMGLDPRDATKRTSRNMKTDQEIIYETMGIWAQIMKGCGTRDRLRVRCDAIEKLITGQNLWVDDRLIPRGRRSRGLWNALRNFAFEKMLSDDENFSEKVTRETNEKWKHPIDSTDYALSRFAHGAYKALPPRNRIGSSN